jgi:hypothetical protein
VRWRRTIRCRGRPCGDSACLWRWHVRRHKSSRGGRGRTTRSRWGRHPCPDGRVACPTWAPLHVVSLSVESMLWVWTRMVGGRADRTIRLGCLLCVGAVLTSGAMGEAVAVGALYSTVWRGKVRGESVGGAWAGWSPCARIGANCGPLWASPDPHPASCLGVGMGALPSRGCRRPWWCLSFARPLLTPDSVTWLGRGADCRARPCSLGMGLHAG